MVTSFKYLGQVILETGNKWPAVVIKLARAKTVWSRMPSILSREGATPWVSGLFFKSVIQVVLIFGEETWVVTPAWARNWGGFHTQVARCMTGKLPRRTTGGMWRYTSAVAAREATGFLTMEEYVRRRQNTVTQYTAKQ